LGGGIFLVARIAWFDDLDARNAWSARVRVV
jgi:hypothetical protein